MNVILVLLMAAGAQAVDFSATDHCVAWKAKKRILLVGSQEPVGRNCQIATRVVQSDKGFRIFGVFPLKAFSSDSEGRDEAVRELLGAKTDPDLNFESEPLSAEQYREIWSKGGKVGGVLKFGGNSRTTAFQIIANGGGTIRGTCATAFSALGLEAPTVLGGLGAKVADELELSFQFQKAKISDSPSP